jgi:serine/threonine protein kinase
MHRPDEATLRRFLLGQLSEAEAATVEALLETDPSSVEVLERISADDAFTSMLRGRTAEPPIAPETEELARRLAELLISQDAEQTKTAGEARSESDATFTEPAPADVSTMLSPPQSRGELGRLGEYRILRVLGEGGMGIVFEAEDIRLGRTVAVKVMRPSFAESETARSRFIREAKAAAAIEHDHVVHIHLIAEERGVPFLVMPLLKGESLDACLKRERTLPADEIVRIGREVAEGLAAAHDRGLIHRDVKPANIWLEAPTRRVKILDFGLARGVNPEGGLPSDITQSGAVVGTPAYMSPEQGRGRSLDARSDLFSLGSVLYRAATGRPPFDEPDTASVLMALASDTPDAPHIVNPQVPPALSALIMRLMEKDASRRPTSAREVSRLLSTTLSAEVTDTVELSPATTSKIVRRGGRRWRNAIAAVVALLVIFGIVYSPTIVRVATNKGELEIKFDDREDVEVFITPKAAHVVMDKGKTKERRFELKAGEYEVEFFDPDSGARAFTKEFKIERGGKTIVWATMADVVAARKPKIEPRRIEPLTGPSGSDKPPSKNRFPGELELYETFDDPKTCSLFRGDKDGISYAVDRGLYVVTSAKGASVAAVAGPKLADAAFSVSFRSEGKTTIPFRGRIKHDGARSEYYGLRLEIDVEGKWRVEHTEGTSEPASVTFAHAPLRTSDVVDPNLVAGQWITVAVMHRGPEFEVWLNGKSIIKDRVNDRIGLYEAHKEAVNIVVWPVVEAKPLRLALDHLAIWKLPPVSPLELWAGDTPPPSNLFPGERVFHDTFDDSKASSVFQGTKNKVTYEIKEGKYTVNAPVGSDSMAIDFGPQPADVGFALRVRHWSGLRMRFRDRKTKGPKEAHSWLEFKVNDEGGWSLRQQYEETIPLGKKDGVETKGRTTAFFDVASGPAVNRDLASGKWLFLAGRFVGDEFELWINGTMVKNGSLPKGAPAGETFEPSNAAISLTIEPDQSRIWEIDDVAIWNVRSSANSALSSEFFEIHGATESELKQWFGRLPLGFRPVWIAVRAGAVPAKFDSVALNDPTVKKWKVEIMGDEPNQGDEPWKMNPLDGLRLTAVTPYRSEKGQGAVANWISRNSIAWHSYHGTREHILSHLKTVSENRWRVTSLAALNTGTYDRWRIEYERLPGVPFEYRTDLSATELEASIRDARTKGMLPRIVSAVQNCDPPRFLALFDENAGSIEWDFQFGMSVTEYEKELVARKTRKMYPQCVISFVVDKTVHYSAVWVGKKSSPQQQKADAQREAQAAAWATHHGGTAWLSMGGESRPFKRGDTLPKDSFVTERIDIPSEAKITDAGLSAIAGLTGLRILVLADTPIGNGAVEHIESCIGLTDLHLNDTKIGDDGVVRLKSLSKLRALSLANTGVSNRGVAALRDLKELENLNLHLTSVTDAALADLAKFPALRELWLSRTKVSDKGLAQLNGMKSLRHLTLTGTGVTADGAAKLAASIPNCQIDYDGGTIKPKE